jgi:Phage integrase, N-terminal SAM-like domain
MQRQTSLPGKPKLLNQLRVFMRARRYSLRTEEAYLDWIRRFIERWVLRVRRWAFVFAKEFLVHSYYDLSSSVALFQIFNRLRDVTQLVSPIDDGLHLAALHKIR